MKTYTKIQEKHLLNRAERYRTIDEIRKMNTRQGKFERSFLHYNWTDDDFEQNRIFEIDNSKAALMGRRDFSLRSPADIVQFNLDFEYCEDLLAKTDTWLLIVFRAVFYGFSYGDLGIPASSWYFFIGRIERLLGRCR